LKALFFGERLEMEFQVGDFFWLQGSDFCRLSGSCHQIVGGCHQFVIGFLALAYSHKENPRQVGNLLLDHEHFLMRTYN